MTALTRIGTVLSSLDAPRERPTAIEPGFTPARPPSSGLREEHGLDGASAAAEARRAGELAALYPRLRSIAEETLFHAYRNAAVPAEEDGS